MLSRKMICSLMAVLLLVAGCSLGGGMILVR